MGKPSKAVLDFMEQYQVASDEIWEVHGSTWVVKHKALERVAAEQGIVFEEPKYLPDSDVKQGFVTILVSAVREGRREWSFGEAGPKNNKNSYPVAMAEKRGKDRVILKLLNSHGALYSEAEFDAEEKPARLAKKDAKGVYTKLQEEMRSCSTRETLKEWGAANKDRINVLPEEWEDTLRLQYEEHLADLRQKEAA